MLELIAQVDRLLFALVNQTLSWPPLDAAFLVLTHKFFYLGAAALAALYLPARYRRAGLYAVLAAAFAVALADVTTARLWKPLFARVRPPFALPHVRLLLPHQPPSPSFPSGHAANAFAFAFVILCSYKRVGAAFLVVAAAVSYSRVYVGVHYPLDVLGGAGWGVFVGVCVVSGQFYLSAFWKRARYKWKQKKRRQAPPEK